MIKHLVTGIMGCLLTLPGCAAPQAKSPLSGAQTCFGFPWDEAKVTMYQRASKRLPIADGSLRVELGDITGGRVLVTVYGPDGEIIGDSTLMGEGNAVSVPQAGQEYVLYLGRLVNLLIGHDFGVFSLMPSKVWQAKSSVPDRLDFPWEAGRMTIDQRTSRKLPGVDGFVQVQLGDITADQVPVTIYGPNNEVVVGTTSMRQGDALSLPLVMQDYVLRLDRLVNLPIGDDYGIFSLLQPRMWQLDSIDHLLGIIAKSDATFLRNDEELNGHEFAAHLRRKYEYYGPRNATVDQFIETIATRSSSTGRPYRIRRPDGQVDDLAVWLREQEVRTVGRSPKDE